ncbi:sugar ABC transporter ATP-binding protein [Herbaspirillum rubrisubalbicans]|uniref:Sugar ABC transporter ATP-binding protein n=1 Tax=Herbaspirillum rubrisubalbicans TaxID=80842 RepID=A0AAD0U9N2_9BURK|nr:sugar ABC transporter ATP-binding protein [Herbaspirillum rubrisubalbicans]ALU89725.1 sugar ABC transporter ATPase [Herbaspirillum rubrisubalbicans M1]AYR24811.1 sugar ABC transporter ATP-binding protein [Herbaspirillum rubrisubalbicans]
MTTEASSARQDGLALRVENLSKRYGAFHALRGITLGIRRGTIHGLLGENGAGKSTLVGLISGQRVPSEGRIFLDGEEIQGADVKRMEAAGVFLVPQEPMIIEHMSVMENLMLGLWPAKRGFVAWRRMRENAARMLAGTGIDAERLAGTLDAVARRKLNILRAMFSGGSIIILDEPTAALTVPDRLQLFAFMRQLRASGVTFIFISHFNDEILDICDAVSVLRDGELVATCEEVCSLSSSQLSEFVLGRELDLFQRDRRPAHALVSAEVISLFGVSGLNDDKLCVDRLELQPGEIIGFTGLPGEGAKELARGLFGLLPLRSGQISFPREPACSLPQRPDQALAMGIAYLSDDRRRDGVVGHLSIRENIALSSLPRRLRAGLVDEGEERQVCTSYFRRMGIKADSAEDAVNTLSGGNQQKVCLGRVLATLPRLLILDEPTRGIDVGVKQDVLRILDQLSQAGVSVIIVSTDVDELARAADRICIFQRGRIAHVVSGDDISTDRLRQLAQ